MSQVPTTAMHVAEPRPSFCALATTYMAWLGGIEANDCLQDHKSITRNHFGTNGSKRTVPGHLGGGLT